jgi:hypothetical protein
MLLPFADVSSRFYEEGRSETGQTQAEIETADHRATESVRLRGNSQARAEGETADEKD